MTLSTLVRPEETAVTEPLAGSAPDQPTTAPGFGVALSLLGAGVVCVVLAIVVLTQLGGGRASEPAPTPAPPNAGAAPGPISVSGPGDITVARQVYEPGQDSGWHTHPGIHAVAVLSGTLTVYDSNCRAQTFELGRPYIGGQELHLARNETAAPVEMSVTYVSPSAPATPTKHLPAPTGCGVAS